MKRKDDSLEWHDENELIRKLDAVEAVLNMADSLEDVVDILMTVPSVDAGANEWCKDCKEYDKENHKCPRFNRVIRTALEDADMVRVVRCKECKKIETITDREGTCYYWCLIHGHATDEWRYCDYGERKTEPQTDIHDLTDCDFCKDRNCKDCEGGKDEPQTEREGE